MRLLCAPVIGNPPSFYIKKIGLERLGKEGRWGNVRGEEVEEKRREGTVVNMIG